MQEATYEQACDMFTDSKCVKIPYKYSDNIEHMQKYLNGIADETGEDIITAILYIESKRMHIVSPSEHYIVNNVNGNEYDAFYINRAYN